VKSRLVLPFWYRLTRVVPEKGPLNVCSVVWIESLSNHSGTLQYEQQVECMCNLFHNRHLSLEQLMAVLAVQPVCFYVCIFARNA